MCVYVYTYRQYSGYIPKNPSYDDVAYDILGYMQDYKQSPYIKK